MYITSCDLGISKVKMLKMTRDIQFSIRTGRLEQVDFRRFLLVYILCVVFRLEKQDTLRLFLCMAHDDLIVMIILNAFSDYCSYSISYLLLFFYMNSIFDCVFDESISMFIASQPKGCCLRFCALCVQYLSGNLQFYFTPNKGRCTYCICALVLFKIACRIATLLNVQATKAFKQSDVCWLSPARSLPKIHISNSMCHSILNIHYHFKLSFKTYSITVRMTCFNCLHCNYISSVLNIQFAIVHSRHV